MESKAFWLITGAVLASVAAYTLPIAWQQPGGGAKGQPPESELWWNSYDNGVAVMRRTPEVSAKVHLDTMGREVMVYWQWIPPSDSEFDVKVVENDFDTDFWPTGVSVIDSDRILVAGRTLKGKTVLECWEFGPHMAATLNFGGGLTYDLTPGQRTDVTRFFTADEDGKRDVAAMTPLVGNANEIVLVQFWDSQDIYEVNLATGAHSLVAGSSAGIVIPELATRKHRGISWADHVSAGYVYFLGEGEEHLGAVITLLDSNRDGVLDGHVVLDSATWVAGNWSSPSSYILPD